MPIATTAQPAVAKRATLLSGTLAVAFAFYVVSIGIHSISSGPGNRDSLKNKSTLGDKKHRLSRLDKNIDLDAPALLDGEAGTATVRWYPSPAREYSRRELLADRIVNFGGLFSAIIGVQFLCYVSWAASDPFIKQAALWTHGVCFIMMLACSATFHYYAWDQQQQRFLLMLDHFGINLMIAGCYTPVLLQCRCFRVLSLVWMSAIIGFIGESLMYSAWKQALDHEGAGVDRAGSSMFFFHSGRYLMMGWSILWVWREVQSCFSPHARLLMVAGGIAYSLGVPFHLSSQLEFHHAVWHSFVFVGSAFFYTTFLTEVAAGRKIGEPHDALAVNECWLVDAFASKSPVKHRFSSGHHKLGAPWAVVV
eukprot:TRINITY_DN15045_c0_g1_i1.p1 TRINITY_DN15045_c0_g1~~TRINITY_DN15045_c0_g1_i1.p1  ORF type:complete len:365 (-),score=34.51 TRINITY_DN15045_c0_g1_i1:147-1241(-)